MTLIEVITYMILSFVAFMVLQVLIIFLYVLLKGFTKKGKI